MKKKGSLKMMLVEAEGSPDLIRKTLRTVTKELTTDNQPRTTNPRTRNHPWRKQRLNPKAPR